MPRFDYMGSGNKKEKPQADGMEKKAGRRRSISFGGLGTREKLPVKRTINLAEIGVKKTDPKAVAAGLILIVLGTFLFSKFLVTDRLAAMFRAESEVTRLRTELNQQYARIKSFGDIEDEYAHYTYAGMTEEELSLVDRSDVIQMLENELGKENTAIAWSLSGNVLTLTATGSDLQEINRLARRMETYDVVNMCSVTNAVKEDVKVQQKTDAASGNVPDAAVGQKIVRANITAYLQQKTQEQQETQEQQATQEKQ